MRPKFILTVLFLISTLCAAETGKPKIIAVPGDYKTIQEAIDTAASGDTVTISPGTYRETLRLKDGVNLAGVDRDICVLMPADDSAVFILKAEGCKKGSIKNLTFDARKNNAPEEDSTNAVEILDSTVRVEELLVRNASNYGILVSGSGTLPVVRKCTVTGCRVGISFDGDLKATVEENACKGNSYGMAVTGANANLFIRKNQCVYNLKSGFSFEADAKATIEGNDFSFNGECGMLAMAGNPVLKNNKLNGNKDYGIYIVTDLSSPVIDKSNQFKGNGQGDRMENN